jgi:hypothetical protein
MRRITNLYTSHLLVSAALYGFCRAILSINGRKGMA